MQQNGQRTCVSLVAGAQSIAHVLSAAGMGSLSRCDGIVRGGRVAVDGQVIRAPGGRVDPCRQAITVDGHPLSNLSTCRYLLLYKPYGVLCAFTDPAGRRTLADFVDVPGVYAAGRLDLDSEGLVLLTDDGWLIHRLSHPRYQQHKIYLVQVERRPDDKALEALRRGVVVKGRRTQPAAVELLRTEPDLPPRIPPIRYRKSVPTAWLRVALTEGRKRQVRHMTAAVGHPTLRLVRTNIGPLELGRLQPGHLRELSAGDLETLKTELSQRSRR